jgi:hypothetical protein
MFWVFAILHAYTAYRSMPVRRDVAIEFVLFSLLYSTGSVSNAVCKAGA